MGKTLYNPIVSCFSEVLNQYFSSVIDDVYDLNGHDMTKMFLADSFNSVLAGGIFVDTE